MMRRMYRHVRSVDLRLGLTVFEDGIVRDPLRQLNLNIALREVHNIRLRVVSETNNVGEIELQLSARVVRRRNLVTADNRSVQRRRRPIAGVSALGRHIPMNHADSSYALISLRWSLTGWSIGIGLSFHARRLVLRLPCLHGRTRLVRGARTFLSRLRQRMETEKTCQRQDQHCETPHESAFHKPPLCH